MGSRSGRSRGFTLVEILISIVLAGILSSVVAVGVTRMFSASSGAVCETTAQQARTGLVQHDLTRGVPATSFAELVGAGLLVLPDATTMDPGGRRIVGDGWQLVLSGTSRVACALDTTARPLDAMSAPAAAAFGTRLLTASYTGPALRVVRSTDGASSDIGFTSTGELDTAALLAFTGTADARVSTWYDQSGNGVHATQTIDGLQPRIVTAGVVETSPRGLPHVVFDGAVGGDFLDVGFTPSASLTFNAVATPSVQTTDTQSCCRAIVGTAQRSVGGVTTGVALGVVRRDWTGAPATGAWAWGHNGVTTPTGFGTTGRTMVATGRFDEATIRLRVDERSWSTPRVGHLGTLLTIGGDREIIGRRFAGGVSEVVVVGRALTDADVVTLEAAQRAR
jgi:prepilin-type N-terminal cleavage/methylation domain-containing protein